MDSARPRRLGQALGEEHDVLRGRPLPVRPLEGMKIVSSPQKTRRGRRFKRETRQKKKDTAEEAKDEKETVRCLRDAVLSRKNRCVTMRPSVWRYNRAWGVGTMSPTGYFRFKAPSTLRYSEWGPLKRKRNYEGAESFLFSNRLPNGDTACPALTDCSLP